MKILKLPIGFQCNLKCNHCNIWNLDYKSVSIERLFKYVDWFIELFPDGLVGFHGGEPLLNSNFLKLYEYISKYNVKVNIETNGTLLNEKFLNIFNENNLFSLNISLDSHIKSINNIMRGQEFAYDKTLNGINLCKDLTFNKYLVTILCKSTINNMIDYFDFCDSKNFTPIINQLEPSFGKYQPISKFKNNKELITPNDFKILTNIYNEYNKRYTKNTISEQRIENIKRYYFDLFYSKEMFDKSCNNNTIIINRDESISVCWNYQNIHDVMYSNTFEEFSNFAFSEILDKKVCSCDKYCSIGNCKNKYEGDI